MREYFIKRGYHPDMEALIREYFGASGNPTKGVAFVAQGIGKISLRQEGTSLFIETEPQPDMAGSPELIKKWKNFLFDATGRTAKERKKMMEKQAKRE